MKNLSFIRSWNQVLVGFGWVPARWVQVPIPGKWFHKETSLRLSADFSTETLEARREWHNIFKVIEGNNLKPRILYPARLSFRFDGKIKSFPDKENLTEFSTTKPALQQMLKELLWAEKQAKEKTYLQKINPKQSRNMIYINNTVQNW